jgi:glucuronate isomerase
MKSIFYSNAAVSGGAFSEEGVKGKMQFGSGWWFNDQKHGIENQLRALEDMGLLARFVGMLTDSRSFLSFPRHEYFRRILCDVLGKMMEAGEAPADYGHIGGIVRDLCWNNAEEYFGIPAKNR